jgi:alpha-beta hydrolase superfamily lysophospholipase
MTTTTLSSPADGLPITVHRWSPSGPPRGTVVVAHGMGEHALRYADFAAALTDRGLEVVAPDHRGHGRSAAATAPGDFGAGGWEGLVADLAALVDAAAAPVVLFGHSMGSLAAQQYAIEHDERLAGLVLSGSTCFDALPAPGDDAGGLESFNAPFEPARTPFDWLSRDPDAVDRYIADPLCGFDAGPEALAGMLGAAARIAEPAALAGLRRDLPVLVVAGDADPLNAGGTLIDALITRWREAGVGRIDRRLWAGGRHEMLNETNRGEVTSELVAWIDARTND